MYKKKVLDLEELIHKETHPDRVHDLKRLLQDVNTLLSNIGNKSHEGNVDADVQDHEAQDLEPVPIINAADRISIMDMEIEDDAVRRVVDSAFRGVPIPHDILLSQHR